MDKSKIKSTFDKDYGVIISVEDEDTADLLDDFLTEKFFVFYNTRDKNGLKEFIFGFASSVERVQLIIDSFLKDV
ncbi:MAG: hypothetical protein ACW7DR_09035 [Paraglaciecola chathamensis]|uniref:Uncharacterized protein n=1 Tax=Paraglaciecola mesophila TaxID=197222 RepID=A0A857JFD8_9ALTE|nr:hypothetical protein [Paraglaciecola mesophila]QHJ09962.1 hypothetical protein FX988_00171 [Paraglaciecola mesophila]